MVALDAWLSAADERPKRARRPRDRPGRSRGPGVHLRHDGPTEGGHALARQHPRQHQGDRGAPARRKRGRVPVVPAAVAHARAHLRLLLSHRRRFGGRFLAFGEAARRRLQVRSSDRRRLRAADLRALLCGDHGAAGGAQAGATRAVRPRPDCRPQALRGEAERRRAVGRRPGSLAGARPSRGRAGPGPVRRPPPDRVHRRRADRRGRHPALPRPGPRYPAGLRDDGIVAGGVGQRPGRQRRALCGTPACPASR